MSINAGTLIESRIDLAARAAARLLREATPTPIAVGIVGSTAHGRCLIGSDLDLVALVDAAPAHAVTSSMVDGVRIDVEWLSSLDARCDAGRGGWIWELRKSARLGTALPLHDPDGALSSLAELAAAAPTDPVRYRRQLEDTESQLGALQIGGMTEAESLRGALDSLAMLCLLITPYRYQKAKWTIDDLLDAGHDLLVGAIIDAYAIGARPLNRVVEDARAFVEAALSRSGEPDCATLVAMGYAPDHAAASYVARSLYDAADLMENRGFEAAAHYCACFSVRLASRLPGCGEPSDDPAYRACFAGAAATPRAVAAAYRAIDSCRAWLADAAAEATA